MLLLSTLTQILLGTLVITAVLLGTAIGYFYVRVRRTESGDLTDKERDAISQRDQEIAMIRSRIEDMHQRQVGASDTQNAVFRQQLEEMQEHLTARGRQIEGLQGQIRNEMAQRQQAMEELQAQMRELLSIVSSQHTLQTGNTPQIQAPAHAPEPPVFEEAPFTAGMPAAQAPPPVESAPVPRPEPIVEENPFAPADPFAGQVAFTADEPIAEENPFAPADPFAGQVAFTTNEPVVEENPFAPADPFAGQVAFTANEPIAKENPFAPADPFAGQVAFEATTPPVEETPFTLADPFAGQVTFEATTPIPQEVPLAPVESPLESIPFTPINPFAQPEPEPLPVVPENAFTPAFKTPFAPEQREEIAEPAQPETDSFTWEPVVLDFDFEEKTPTAPAAPQDFRQEAFAPQQPAPAPQPAPEPEPAREEPTFAPVSSFTEKPATSTPDVNDGFSGVIEWTTFSDEEPTPASSGDGQMVAAEEPAPQPEPQPEHTEELTQLPMIDEQRQGILYSLDVYTIEDVARFSRADARRVSEAIEGTSEDEVMNEWVFAAQSILFERYQAELRRRRSQAA